MSRLAAYGRRRTVAVGDSAVVSVSADVELRVVYESHARQHVIRPITYDEFCQRCQKQGRSQWQFAGFYTHPAVAEWCGTADARERWQEIREELAANVSRVHELESDPAALEADNGRRRAELHRLYGWTFDAFKLKGIAEAAGWLAAPGHADRDSPERNALP